MVRARIHIIAAVGEKTRAIGKHNELLWHISDDLRRFKNLTVGHPVVMGRKTFESIGHPLPDRMNIVITKNEHYAPKNVHVVHSLPEAIEHGSKFASDIFIIGGGQIYQESLPMADILHLTLVKDESPGDTYFPDWNSFGKKLTEERKVDPKSGLHFTWLDLEKEKQNNPD